MKDPPDHVNKSLHFVDRSKDFAIHFSGDIGILVKQILCSFHNFLKYIILYE